MKVLYLDTSSSFLYIGIYEDGKMITELKENLGSDLSVYALAKIANAFEISKITPKEINKIILVNGPGSFTGIRIGITIAKVYAWAENIAITTISSLEAMTLSSSKEVDYIIPIIDARREAVYTAIYNKNNEPVMLGQYTTLEALKVAVDNLPGSSIYISNDSNINIDSPIEPYTPNFIKIIEKNIDKENINPHFIDANYLKKTEAEEKRETTNDYRNK